MAVELDSVDRGILHLLQRDARNTTAREMGDEIGVSPSTVRNRIDQLEATGVIEGYRPELDYEAAGFQLRVLFVITAPPTDRSDYLEELLGIQGIVDIRETLTGTRNLYVECVATNTRDITRMTDAIHDLGLEIETSDLVNQRRMLPFDQFSPDGDFEGEE